MKQIWRTHRMTLVQVTAVVAAIGAFASASLAQSFFDNFNDGDDAGWTHYQPLSPFGAGGTYSFPSGGYRMQAPPSPNVGALGVSRVGSMAPASANTGSSFAMSADLMNLGGSTDQSYGLVFHAQQPGLGSSDGYILYFLTDATRTSGRLIFNRIDNELGTPVGTAMNFAVTPNMQYQLRVIGSDSSYRGEIYDLAAPGVLMGLAEMTESTYASGQSGLLISGRTIPNVLNPPLDATFDNYYVVPAPGSAALLALCGLVVGRRRRRVGING